MRVRVFERTPSMQPARIGAFEPEVLLGLAIDVAIHSVGHCGLAGLEERRCGLELRGLETDGLG
jgi:hypothetical protein